MRNIARKVGSQARIKTGPLKPRPKRVLRILAERGERTIGPMMDTPNERVKRLISSESALSVKPLDQTPRGSLTKEALQVMTLARKILLDQRTRASATFTDKYGIPRLDPVPGLDHFVLPMQRVHFIYCSHYKCSDGVREFLAKNLARIATENKTVNFVVESRWGHAPLMRATYSNHSDDPTQQRSRAICLRGFGSQKVADTFEELRNASGASLQPFSQQVKSTHRAVRPIWSPFHTIPTKKNSPLSQI